MLAPKEGPPSSLRSTVIRFVKVTTILLGLILLGLIVASWLGGDPADLPFEYDGFD